MGQSGAVLCSDVILWKYQITFLATGCQREPPDEHAHAYNRFKFVHTLILLAMTDTEFLTLAEKLLKAVEASCDRINDSTDADLDNQRVGGMITITFANRSQIIINLQKPLQEVWMATKAGGYHYKYDSVWRCTREGSEFFDDLSKHSSAQSGQALVFLNS